MVEVWYIRHGESEANAGLATENPGTIPLTPSGYEQARKVSLAFEKAPDLIITSKYTRTIQTARPTTDRFSKVPIETCNIHEFTYLSHAKLGVTTKQERKPLLNTYWDKCDPNYIHGEGAESFKEFMGRVQAIRERIHETDSRFIAIFGHGIFTKAILWANLLGSLDITEKAMRNFCAFYQSFNFPNCALIKAEYRSDKAFFSGLITDHLKELASWPSHH